MAVPAFEGASLRSSSTYVPACLPPVAGCCVCLCVCMQGPPPEGVREVAHRLDISAQLKAQGNDAYRQVSAGIQQLWGNSVTYTQMLVVVVAVRKRIMWDGGVLLSGVTCSGKVTGRTRNTPCKQLTPMAAPPPAAGRVRHSLEAVPSGLPVPVLDHLQA